MHSLLVSERSKHIIARSKLQLWHHRPFVRCRCPTHPHQMMSIFTTFLLHHPHPVNWEQTKELVCCVPWVQTNVGVKAFHSCAPFLWNSLPLSVSSATSVATFKKRLKTHLFDLAFPQRHQHSRCPVDATELLHRLCYWAPIWLLRHWAWLLRVLLVL